MMLAGEYLKLTVEAYSMVFIEPWDRSHHDERRLRTGCMAVLSSHTGKKRPLS
jgi:hypothetical protein